MVDAIDAIKILGGLLGNSGGSSTKRGAGGGGDILTNILKGALGGSNSNRGSSSGGGDLLGGLLGMAMKQFGQANPKITAPAQNTGGGRFQPNFGNAPEPQINANEANQQAILMIRAMVTAAKADGKVDKQEGENIIGRLGEVSQAEAEFVRQEVAADLDVDGFIRSIPRGMEKNIYAVSLMAIDLDSNPEAHYLHQLAQGLNITPEVSNQIHDKLGAPKIYS